MVSAPDTNWMSGQATPASASAARAATNPYSTKLRPHLPHGCMPAPSTATSRSVLMVALAALAARDAGRKSAGSRARFARRCESRRLSRVRDGGPLPDHVLVLGVFIERSE